MHLLSQSNKKIVRYVSNSRPGNIEGTGKLNENYNE